MCFSAGASFGAGVVLSVIGVASLIKVQHPRQIMFASIPLIFAVQQFAEGFLWLILPNSGYIYLQQAITYVFLFFAQILWPAWVPVAILLLDKESKRKKIQRILVGTGLAVSVYLSYFLLSYHVQAKIIGHHILYKQDYAAAFGIFGGIFYIMATIAPPFFSHIKRMWMFGATILISYIITVIFYEHFVVSVWCFFASIISISIFLIMVEIHSLNKKPLKEGHH
jgi:hypothetical protein